ncbi:YhcG family protein [Capnocytophaga leadbetteri]|jgi:hypothetical protein|uniref:PDDEXK nuclease domain-containing protein n=1 Tax=Capnocytophaga leadbetteri TaxID=327575 RepID=UPI0028D42CDF|nr:PDDEXK nuclease domain-containing protein [Capnocytophaga leadbetteri]
MKKLALTFDYDEMLSQAVNQIRNGRNYLAKQLSSTISSVYWNLGKLLFDRHLEEGYGSGVVKQLSADLKREFPDMGLSPRNLWYMKRLYERYYQSDTKLQRSIAVLPWRHNILLLDKQVTDEEVIFYSNEVIEKGWSQEMLLNAIKMNTFAFQQQQQKSNNFEETLPKLHAEFANEVFKNSYNLGFLEVIAPIYEISLEKRLVERIKQFILELGKGFSFIGNQYRLEFNNKEYFVDMLFFHRGLRSLVAIELKVGDFKPEYIGKMNFYLTLLDRLEKGTDENPSIGIILCAEKDHLEVEVALQDIHKPIGVAVYQLLPQEELRKVILSEMNKV